MPPSADRNDETARHTARNSAPAFGDVESQPPSATPAVASTTAAPVASVAVAGTAGAAALFGAEVRTADVAESRMSVLTFCKIVTALSALYMCTNPWFLFYDADKGEICPYTVICATNAVEMTLLTFSRMSAGALYASLFISILAKCYATRSFLHHSWLGAVLEFEPTHDVHIYFGYLSLCAGFEHGLLHCARFIYSNEAWLIYETDTGRSGMVACCLLLPIVLPMKFEFFRTKMSFQVRKNLHMLFLPMLVALCFHSAHFRYAGSLLLVWYLLDRLYFTTKQTFLIDHPAFEAVGRGTMVALDLPLGYTFKAGSYIYVNSPAISRSEWHPFSIIQAPGSRPRAIFYAEAVGDWTQELFRLGLEQPRLPLWITAAQPSLMEKSIYYDNIVLVCTGAGITPAVSIIERYCNKKNIHLLWMTRDGGMVALFEKQVREVKSTVHVTGKQNADTKDALQKLLSPPLVHAPSLVSQASLRSIIENHTFTTFPPVLPRLGDQLSSDMSSGYGQKTAGNFDGDSIDLSGRASMNLPETPRFRMLSSEYPDMRRQSSVVMDVADPVNLVFGRPDISKYLMETFAHPTAQKDMDDSFRSGHPRTKHGDHHPIRTKRQVSARLNDTQKKSKMMLMKADAQVLDDHSPAVGGDPNSFSNLGCGNSRPWLVLYCGANPKVETAIAETCDELKVEWRKEYFGAW